MEALAAIGILMGGCLLEVALTYIAITVITFFQEKNHEVF